MEPRIRSFDLYQGFTGSPHLGSGVRGEARSLPGADMIYTQAPSGGVFRGLWVSAWVTMRESVHRDGRLKDGKQTRASDKHPSPRSRCVCVCARAVRCVAQSSRAHLDKCHFFPALLFLCVSLRPFLILFSSRLWKRDVFLLPRTHGEEKSTAAAGNRLCKRCRDCAVLN